MENIVLFGNKDSFAIQLGQSPKVDKQKLCLWLNKTQVGSYTRGGPLKEVIKTYRKFVSAPDQFWLPELEGMNATQIVKYLIYDMFELLNSTNPKDAQEYKRRDPLSLIWGRQFTNDWTDILVLCHRNNVNFIYRLRKEPVAQLLIIPFSHFCSVFDEFVAYSIQQKLI